MKEEDRQRGAVSFSTYAKYIRAAGGEKFVRPVSNVEFTMCKMTKM